LFALKTKGKTQEKNELLYMYSEKFVDLGDECIGGKITE
jgi:hypothetical protein